MRQQETLAITHLHNDSSFSFAAMTISDPDFSITTESRVSTPNLMSLLFSRQIVSHRTQIP